MLLQEDLTVDNFSKVVKEGRWVDIKETEYLRAGTLLKVSPPLGAKKKGQDRSGQCCISET